MDLLRKGFCDIARGYSSGYILSKEAYIRHMSHFEQIEQDDKREEFFNYAKHKGLRTNDEKLKELIKNGFWSEAKEKELNDSKEVLLGLYEGKRNNIKMPSAVKDYMRLIEAEEKRYNEKAHERTVALGLTCEVFAERQLNDFYIISNIFKDKDLKTPLFKAEDIDSMDDESDIEKIVKDFNSILACCSEENIKKISIQPFFQNYFFIVGDNLIDFFGKPICNLTFFQVSLIRQAQRVKAIHQNFDTSKWPKEVLENADLFVDYADTVANSKKQAEENGAFEEGSVTIGMKKEDSQVLGVKAVDLAQKAKESNMSFLDFLTKKSLESG